MTETQTQTEELIHFEYQHTDEKGNAIIDPHTGKQAFTNFTGKNWQEIAEKTRDAHLNVTRFAARLRSQKPIPKEPEAQRKELSVEEERQAAVDLQDPAKARAAGRKLLGIDDLEERQKKLDDQKRDLDIAAARLRFVTAHGQEGLNDYHPCQANSTVLMKYITDNDLDPRSIENYEVAFNASGHLLAQRPTPVQATPPANEPPPPPPARQSSGGVQPGELSGQRPTKRPKNEITKEYVTTLCKTAEGRAEFRKRLKREPDFSAQVTALGIRPLGNF